MTNWEQAAGLILPDLVDCPWELARDRLINASREFYTRSLAWRSDIDPFPLQANVDTYDAVDTLRSEVVRVLECWVDNQEIEPLTADQFTAERARGPAAGPPEYMSVIGNQFVLLPSPTTDGALCRVSVALRPSFKAVGLDDTLWAQHIEAIVDGAKARLYMSQGKPYTDATLGLESKQRFEDRISTEYWMRARSRARGRGRVRGHFY